MIFTILGDFLLQDLFAPIFVGSIIRSLKLFTVQQKRCKCRTHHKIKLVIVYIVNTKLKVVSVQVGEGFGMIRNALQEHDYTGRVGVKKHQKTQIGNSQR